MKKLKTKILLSILPICAIGLMAASCEDEIEDEVIQNCQIESCKNSSIVSTHTNVNARIYDLNSKYEESTEEVFVIVYSTKYVETNDIQFNQLDSLIAPCEPLPIEFQKNGLPVTVSFALSNCCDIFSFANIWKRGFGCLADILDIEHANGEN